jgi:hypothetical protein
VVVAVLVANSAVMGRLEADSGEESEASVAQVDAEALVVVVSQAGRSGQ